ncbi:MAG: hypothetical protein HOQ24_03320, partial [Mycobacteriaceae bacterium]|nr:hypothetical protein [Mycobacteriaceae bacterium]
GASTAVELAIDAANQHVRYLVTQIGSGNAELPDMGGDGGFLSDADITALAGKSGDDYQDALTEITLEADGYEDLDKDFFKDVSTLMKEHKGTYKCIKDAVDGFSEAVKELGSIKDGKQDEAVLGYLDTSVTGVKKAVQGYNEMFGDKDDGADDEEKKDDEDTEDDDKEDTEDDDTKDDDTKDDEETTEDEGGGDDGGDSEDSGDSGASNDYQGSPVYDPSTGTTDYSDQYKDIIGADTGKENADATAPSTEDAKDDAISSVLESLGSPASAAAPVSAPASAPSGGVGDLASLLGPMAAMNSMAAAQQQDRAHQADHRRTAAEDDAAASWPAPADPAAQPGNPPNVTAPAIAGPPAAPAVPGRSVDISLPDGSTARASAVAADAVHREMNNHNGSDAKAAYAGTVAESTSQHPWAPVDAGKLATGDVVQWANRTALVVVTPQGPRYLEGGRLVVLNPAAMDHDGTFQGFFHPTGADARAPEPAV